jgi:outer membrane autotransporter protein
MSGTNWKTSLQTGDIRGNQFNALAGVSYRISDNVVIGVLGGYENFDYTSQRLVGRLKGDGWTAGGYFGWRFLPGLRLDLGLAHSLVGFDGKAGTADGTFAGVRWLGTLGLAGTYKFDQFILEPSARVYMLREHENAYVDSLGTRQDARNFFTGRASTGAKLEYSWAQFDGVKVLPFVGLFGDYYLSSDNASATSGTPLAAMHGWSARVTGGVAINWASGPSLLFGTELGGLGSGQFLTWSGRSRLSVPF